MGQLQSDEASRTPPSLRMVASAWSKAAVWYHDSSLQFSYYPSGRESDIETSLFWLWRLVIDKEIPVQTGFRKEDRYRTRYHALVICRILDCIENTNK
jgi:hypothetical protein